MSTEPTPTYDSGHPQVVATLSDHDPIRRPLAAIRRISWGAVFAGTVLALVIQLSLSLLGLGIGLGTVDPL